jgi:hypothetical protein
MDGVCRCQQGLLPRFDAARARAVPAITVLPTPPSHRKDVFQIGMVLHELGHTCPLSGH